jgi:signal peptidase
MTSLSARSVATAVLTVVMVFFVAVFVVQAAPGVVGAEESYVVLSGSMEPEISPGDAVVVKSVDPADVESGDVITYKRASDAKPVTHRVVEVQQQNGERVFRTQGDANEDPDPSTVPASSVVGEVWFSIPLVGHVVLFADTVLGRVVLVGLPLLALAVSELYNFLAADEDAGDGDAPADDPAAAAEPHAHVGTVAEQAERPADDAPASPTAGPDVAASEADGVTLTTYDLRLSSVGFGLLALYSGYVAYLDPTPVRVSIFAGAVMVVVFLAGVFLFGGSSRPTPHASRTDGGDPTDTSEDSADDAVRPSADTDAATDGGEDDGA